jgi:3-methyl-2-oxobutanoate hydroxymethyltransferase
MRARALPGYTLRSARLPLTSKYLTGHFDRAQKIAAAVPLHEGQRPHLAERCARGEATAVHRGLRAGLHLRAGAMPAKNLLARLLSAAAQDDAPKKKMQEGSGGGGGATALYGGGGSPEAAAAKPVTVATLRGRHRRGEKLTMLTAYDYPSAKLADEAGVDILLVGDSVGMVVLGYDSTTPVTMDEMLHHCRAVSRGAPTRPFRVGDMPFGSYLTPQDAATNAVRLVKDGSMDCVKLEGGAAMAPQVEAITHAGINVMGHIGLTPQTAASLGGYRVQGRSAAQAEQLLADARAIEAAGASALVLECVPDRIAAYITAELSIPTIGIGAGKHTTGQVLVMHDVLGLYERHQPKFSRQYLDGASAIRGALRR